MSEAFDEQERYLVRKQGLDYGPYSRDEVISKFRDDEFDEETIVYDRREDREAKLKELEAFQADVKDYVQIREERERRKREAKERFRRRLKKGGKFALISGILAGLTALASMLIYLAIQPEPKPTDFDRAFVSLDYQFLSPPEDFEKLEVNKRFMKELFDPDASKKQLQQRVSRRIDEQPGGSDDKKRGVTEVDFSKSSGEVEGITDRDIENRVLKHWGELRTCIVEEIKQDSSFDRLTVKFYIAPNGDTGGIEILEDVSTRLRQCVVGEFESMTFGRTGLIGNKGVTYPLFRK